MSGDFLPADDSGCDAFFSAFCLQVKRWGCVVVIFSSFSLMAATTLAAQESAASDDDIPGYLMGSVNVLYRFQIAGDFYYLAREAGVYVWDDYAGNFPSTEFWAFSIESYLSGTEHIARLFRYDNETETAEPPLAEAARRNIPVFVDIYVSGDITAGTVTVRYTFTDLFSSLHIVDKTFTESVPTEDDLLLYYWLPIKTDLANFIKPILKPLFTLYGPAGATVTGFTEEALVIPESGVLIIDIPLPGTYAWTMSHERYVTRSGIVFADKDRRECTLPSQKFYPASFDIGVFQAHFPEFWYTRTFRTSNWFFSVGLQQQVISFFPARSRSDEPLKTSFNPAPLIMPGVAGGYRFTTKKPYSPVLYVQGMAQVRINATHVQCKRSGGQLWFDDFSPLSLSLYVGYDWELPIPFILFAEAGASVYLLREGYTASASKGLDDTGFLQQIIGGIVYIELPCFRFGIRIKLPF
ncbi:MAG: hypothetical protein LBP19_04270 [Treponema sp.]|jgi:hypothetical protein|nr:hypothetical protein [Treponema sp.]